MAKPAAPAAAAATGAATPEKRARRKPSRRKSGSTFRTALRACAGFVQQHHRDYRRSGGQRSGVEEFGFARVSADRARARHLPPSRPRQNAASMARDHGVRSVEVRVSGPGSRPRIGASALWQRLASKSATLRTPRRFRTTAAVRRSAAECKRKFKASGLFQLGSSSNELVDHRLRAETRTELIFRPGRRVKPNL